MSNEASSHKRQQVDNSYPETEKESKRASERPLGRRGQFSLIAKPQRIKLGETYNPRPSDEFCNEEEDKASRTSEPVV